MEPRRGRVRRPSTEGERERFDASFEELDFELPVHDRRRLPDQLVQPLAGDNTFTLGVDIDAVRVTRRRPIDRDTKPRGLAVRRGEHEMQIASVETVRDAAAGAVESGVLSANRPVS